MTDEPDSNEAASVADAAAPIDVAFADAAAANKFQVKLKNFEGPFDLLLNLISQHRLDVTELALHQVTDEFIAYTRSMGAQMGLEQTTEFLVVAATLLDLKAARLLPSGEVDDVEDLALLEARDLLFARLLQYRAYKQVAALFAELEAAALQRYPRAVSLESRFEELMPEVTLGVDADTFASIAASAMTPKPKPSVGLGHIHQHQVSVPEHARRMAELLTAKPGTWLTFGELVADCTEGIEVVASFLGLLELFRERAVVFEQAEALGDLSVSWTGDREAEEVSMDESAEEYG
ncbi:chromosome segregation and condensation protein ScpA [Gordonia effusa NBRC 100432]|uniref:Segregation and condensation protein A n=1 Tax=Gordonia effusa NBRC 100432 TaxID=1077974 RepID=H0R4T8_9ACTN|nr:segregation/condensation protein A [Gordonia effusa]GAB20089.1 chromosome segregation and condensation protein ScpA [Gordonia effusa NBRC 100432]